jgi:hypothetical protein
LTLHVLKEARVESIEVEFVRSNLYIWIELRINTVEFVPFRKQTESDFCKWARAQRFKRLQLERLVPIDPVV